MMWILDCAINRYHVSDCADHQMGAPRLHVT